MRPILGAGVREVMAKGGGVFRGWNGTDVSLGTGEAGMTSDDLVFGMSPLMITLKKDATDTSMLDWI